MQMNVPSNGALVMREQSERHLRSSRAPVINNEREKERSLVTKSTTGEKNWRGQVTPRLVASLHGATATAKACACDARPIAAGHIRLRSPAARPIHLVLTFKPPSVAAPPSSWTVIVMVQGCNGARVQRCNGAWVHLSCSEWLA